MKISIAIPTHKAMKDYDFFLNRCLESIRSQTFTDYEVVISEEGNAAHNLNLAVSRCKGEYVKIMCMDDWFAHKDSLKDIAEALEGPWLISGCDNNPNPYYTGDVRQGNNKLGGLSAITVKRDCFIPFDEELVWLLDCDFYARMHARYGLPRILDGVNIGIGVGDHQATNLISDEIKNNEVFKLKCSSNL